MKSVIAVTLLVLGFCALTTSAAQISQCLGQFDTRRGGSSSCVSYCCLCQLVKDAAPYYAPSGSLFYGPGSPYNKIIPSINALFAQTQQDTSCFDPCVVCESGIEVKPGRIPRPPIRILPQPQPISDPSPVIPARYVYEAKKKE